VRIVLDHQLDGLGRGLPAQLFDHAKREIDAGCDPAAGDDVAVDRDPFAGRLRAEFAQRFAREPAAA
jgi:hypothetical protein